MLRSLAVLLFLLFCSDALPENSRYETNKAPTLNSNANNYTTFQAANVKGGSGGWKYGEIKIIPGNLLSFNLHYNLSSSIESSFQVANNVRFHFPDVHRKEMKKGEFTWIFGAITSDNYHPEIGYIKLIAEEDLIIFINDIAWQRANCRQWECREPQTVDILNAINGVGYGIGDVEGSFGAFDSSLNEHFTGNVVLTYSVCPIEYIEGNEIIGKYDSVCATLSETSILGILSCKYLDDITVLNRACFETGRLTFINQIGIFASVLLAVFAAIKLSLMFLRRIRSREDESA